MSNRSRDVVIIGGGAAGLATAIFAARAAPTASITVVDGARTIGAKILVSGGGRCNLTNRSVTERDFNGGPPALVRRVLRALPVDDTVAFFQQVGVALHEEARGKLFPDTNRARTVLDALLLECRSRGVQLVTSCRVASVARTADGFAVSTTGAGPLAARAVVLATGGRSLPRTGSDGSGYELARSLGHSIVDTTPALVPLVLEGGFHASLVGVSAPVELTLSRAGRKPQRVSGSLLYTHFGASGPAALDLSRHWLRERLEGRSAAVTVCHWPGLDFARADALLQRAASARPRAQVATALRDLDSSTDPKPAALADALVAAAGVRPELVLADMDRDARRRLAHALTALPLPIADSRGYDHAEATAGGVDLREIDVATMQSKRCAGVFLVGEVLDVDGRLGGFNFQWAWASARVAGRGIAGAVGR